MYFFESLAESLFAAAFPYILGAIVLIVVVVICCLIHNHLIKNA